MPGRYLLDTNIVIGLLKGRIEDLPKALVDSSVYLSIVVLGELLYGALHSSRADENIAKIERLAATMTVLDCDRDTARFYGRIKASLRRRGRPIPENDIWIAASAQQHGLTVATRDRHFENIEDLSIEAW